MSRRTFVLWISRETAVEAGPHSVMLEGRFEEVETGVERRFGSSEQLIQYLEECLAADQAG
ncbi:MAG: hypothetical protein SFV54_26315 [Bryobacteraceae bacterium]|nr:hypothetical protein [Bryobacteraceae bacterium]